MTNIYTAYKIRFFIAAIVTVANINNQVVWAAFSSIADTAAKFYETTLFGINMMALIYMIVFILVSPVASWVLDEKGIRVSILIGTISTFVGALIKWTSGFAQGGTQRYAICFVGQTIAGIGQPFLCNAPTKVASKWFPPKERIMANACMTIGLPVGIAISLGMSPSIVSGDPAKIPLLNLIVLSMTFFAMILSLFIKHSPNSPPSASAGTETLPFWDGLKALFKNGYYVLLVIMFGLLVGIFNVYVTLLSQYILPIGFTEDDAGMLGVITVVIGLSAALVVNGLLVHYPYHSETLRVCAFTATFGTVLFLLGMTYSRIELLYSGSAAIGLGGFPMEAIVLELGVESSWPIAEGTSAGVLYMSAQLFGIIFLFSANALGFKSFFNAFILNICVCAVSAIMTLFYVDQKKRLKVDRSEDEIKTAHP